MTDEMIAKLKRDRRMKWSLITGLLAGIFIFVAGMKDTPLGRTSTFQAIFGAIMILLNSFSLWGTRKNKKHISADN